jgi:hypothetical protein
MVLTLRDFLAVGPADPPPAQSTIARTRRSIDFETHRETGGTYQEFLKKLAQASGMRTSTRAALAR